MSTSTTNFGLVKPDISEKFSVSGLNDNYDTIDKYAAKVGAGREYELTTNILSFNDDYVKGKEGGTKVAEVFGAWIYIYVDFEFVVEDYVSSSGNIGNTEIFSLWERYSPKRTAVLNTGYTGRVMKAYVSPNGKCVLSAVGGEGLNIEKGETASLTGFMFIGGN